MKAMSKTGFMKITKLLNRRSINSARSFFSSSHKNLSSQNTENTSFVPSNSHLKYSEADEEDSPEVLDLHKERLKYSSLLEEEEEIQEDDKFFGLNLTRGVSGVFDIEDLIETLHNQNSEDIFVASVPKEIKYVDYIVVISGRSQRHMQAIAQFVKRVYKHKRDDSDIVPKLEGENSPDWVAIDLGNIALHIFSRKARQKYDLDSLWAVGPRYDDEYNKKEPVSSILEKHSLYLEGLEPAT